MKYSIIIFLSILMLSLGCTNADKSVNTTAMQAESNQDVPTTEEKKEKTILFFGNSLTAGYGLDLSEAFPALIQQMIDSLELGYKVVNAGLSGETTASGNTRIGWVLSSPADVLVLELGGNDGLRGISTDETYKNLVSIIDQARAANPAMVIIIAGMQIPPNMGETYTEQFKKIYTQIASEKQVALIPFLLQDVGGVPELNLPDGIHPTAEGHKIVAATVWEVLYPLL